jgi:hypothetical protein
MLIVFALVVSIVLAVLILRRVGLTGTGLAVMAAAVALATVQFFMLDDALWGMPTRTMPNSPRRSDHARFGDGCSAFRATQPDIRASSC